MILKERKIEQNTARDYNKSIRPIFAYSFFMGNLRFPLFTVGFPVLLSIIFLQNKSYLFLFYSIIHPFTSKKKTPEPN